MGHVILPAKILFQALWKLEMSWDKSVSQDIYTQFGDYLADFGSLRHIAIPRYALGNDSTMELHAFCDASEKAYGACVYLRVVDVSGVVVRLLCAKSRIAPLKTISLPRL